MDIFWLIPVSIVVIALVVTFYAYLKTRQTPPPNPHVLLDKPSENGASDQSAKPRQWSNRPCGSFLEWLSGRN
jgi:hypothetical protein